MTSISRTRPPKTGWQGSNAASALRRPRKPRRFLFGLERHQSKRNALRWDQFPPGGPCRLFGTVHIPPAAATMASCGRQWDHQGDGFGELPDAGIANPSLAAGSRSLGSCVRYRTDHGLGTSHSVNEINAVTVAATAHRTTFGGSLHETQPVASIAGAPLGCPDRRVLRFRRTGSQAPGARQRGVARRQRCPVPLLPARKDPQRGASSFTCMALPDILSKRRAHEHRQAMAARTLAASTGSGNGPAMPVLPGLRQPPAPVL
jgi:hypothetical protein